jgi:hypothetical protein
MRHPPTAWTAALAAALAALAACSGGDGTKEASGFTAAMLQGRTFYRVAQAGGGPARGLTSFPTGSTFADWEDSTGGLHQVSGTWSIDPAGRLVAASGGETVTFVLVADRPTSLDVTVDDGSGPQPLTLLKTVPLGGQLPGRFLVTIRELAGADQLSGVMTIDAGTISQDVALLARTGSWVADADGAVHLSWPAAGSWTAEDDVVYLVAEGSQLGTPRSLRLAVRTHDPAASGGALTGVLEVVLDQTAATAGFAPADVVDRIVYRSEPAALRRGLIEYQSTGTRREWFEDDTGALLRDWEWSVSPTGAILFGPPGPPDFGALLLDDGPTAWELLVFNGTTFVTSTAQKTVPVAASQAVGTWTVTEHLLDGSTSPGGTVTLAGDFTGTGPDGTPFDWNVTTDGWLVVTPPNGRVSFRRLAGALTADTLELVGVEEDAGFIGLFVITLAR